jgi:hypothetical protein
MDTGQNWLYVSLAFKIPLKKLMVTKGALPEELYSLVLIK